MTSITSVSAFSTESGYDKLTVGGVAYHGTNKPAIGSAGTIQWSSDGSGVSSGWKICGQAKATTTKRPGDASTSVKATCCDDVVKGSVTFVVTLPWHVTPSQFLSDAKVATGVQKGIAKKLGVDHTWVTVILKASTDGRSDEF